MWLRLSLRVSGVGFGLDRRMHLRKLSGCCAASRARTRACTDDGSRTEQKQKQRSLMEATRREFEAHRATALRTEAASSPIRLRFVRA